MRQNAERKNGTADYWVGDRRRYHRFHLHYPVELTFQCGESFARIEGESQNVSRMGLLMNSPWEIPLHTKVNLAMTVQGAHLVRPIRLVADGSIVQLQPGPLDSTFLVAVQFTQPLTKIEAHLDFVLVRPRSYKVG